MKKLTLPLTLVLLHACVGQTDIAVQQSYPAVDAAFGGKINLNNLANYANQAVPPYIRRFNDTNLITNGGATLGRVLFYDKKLSSNDTVSCATCHKQETAFSDAAIASTGVNGSTGRHSMRLINARFAQELKFFWDERAQSLEAQTTMPIRDHGEMGFSGSNADPDFAQLISKLSTVEYYKEMFKFVYGSEEITESRIQLALGQFIRSIQSFDSRFDAGRQAAGANNANFTNYTPEENQGKNLFLAPPTFNGSTRASGGLGCGGCHRAPEFDIDPNSLNNGIIGKIGGGTDLTSVRSPSLRDAVNTSGVVNGPLMHDGSKATLLAMVDHYNAISTTGNTNLDNRLKPGGSGQNLNMTTAEKEAVVAFLKTLSGTNVYTDSKWSSPF